ncbi:MAG: choice-of-anchor tandem repeat GloVer-containing protein, partial [Limisphaerales bacterium]
MKQKATRSPDERGAWRPFGTPAPGEAAPEDSARCTWPRVRRAIGPAPAMPLAAVTLLLPVSSARSQEYMFTTLAGAGGGLAAVDGPGTDVRPGLSRRGAPRLRPTVRTLKLGCGLFRAAGTVGLMLGLSLGLAGRAPAQTFAVLHNFPATNGVAGTNVDGVVPRAGLIISGSTLYGAAVFGGSSGNGTLFKVGLDGAGFTVLHTFAGASDGAAPRAPLLLLSNTLYGTSSRGGHSGNGTIFRVNTNGAAFSTLYHFTATDPSTGTNSDGGQPDGGLVLSSNILFGTASVGGSSGSGSLFKIGLDGNGFSNLHSFSGNDGNEPSSGLILSSNRLYGTTFVGGLSGNGTIFAINTDGTEFSNLYHFSTSAGIFRPNSDGTAPLGSLTIDGGTLYGAAAGGGATGNGTVFKLNTDGSGFTTLYSFSAVPDPDNPPFINDDGSTPVSGLVLV